MISRRPLQIFLTVQSALFFRELNMRFSAGTLGIFWTFFEPFMQVMMMVLIKVLIFQRDGNFDFAVFLALSFIAFNMFKNIVIKSMGAFSANRTLFIYKQVKPINTIISRVIIEFFFTSIILIVFISIGYYFEFDMNIENLPIVTLALIWFILFSFGFGLFMAIVNQYYSSIGKIFTMLSILLMFGSALFYTIEIMPPQIQEYLLYNPLVHFMEMIHGYYFHTLDDRFVDYNYMILWTVTPLFIGLLLYRYLEEDIISS